MQNLQVCNELFDQGMPCMGCPYEEGDATSDFLTSHTPYLRKILKNCSDLLGKGVSTNVPICGECLKLGEQRKFKVGALCSP